MGNMDFEMCRSELVLSEESCDTRAGSFKDFAFASASAPIRTVLTTRQETLLNTIIKYYVLSHGK